LQLEERCLLSADMVLTWNQYMTQAEALDYDPNVVATPDQPGPTNTSRAFAIISAAVYDAVNSIDGSYAPYLAKVSHARGGSIDAAVAQAAHDTLVAMFPHQQATFDQELAASLAGIPNTVAKRIGIRVGATAADNMLTDRANDGSQEAQSYIPYDYPGYHQVDPLHPNQGFLSPQWGEVRPFVLDSSNQFRAADVGLDPQSRLDFLNSSEYTTAYNEVMAYGSLDSTVRTPDQTQIGIFWAYDGSPDIGTPPVSFNEVADIIAQNEGNTEVQNARMLALVNLAMGDAGIAAWESKYFYSFWRPIVGIRNADSTGNPNTPEDPNWQPLGAQKDNGGGTNFTPNFPSYVSGHATFASATFQVLRDFYGTDEIAFSFQSDEYNGVTVDDQGNVRPPVTRSYTNLTQPEMEVHDSRIYLGIHWRFDQDQGLLMGRSVGDFVFQNVMTPGSQANEPDATLAVGTALHVNGGAAISSNLLDSSLSLQRASRDVSTQAGAAVVSSGSGAASSQPAPASAHTLTTAAQPVDALALGQTLGSPELLDLLWQ
jgi:hypothetical protein